MADSKSNLKLHLLEPRATEKTYREQAKRTYSFVVKPTDSKQSVAKLVEKEFNVTVIDVRLLTRKGKQTKFSKGKHAYPGITFRRDKRIAYVTLKEGDSIKVFDEPDKKEETKADAKEAKKVAKTTKKADKNAGKENK